MWHFYLSLGKVGATMSHWLHSKEIFLNQEPECITPCWKPLGVKPAWLPQPITLLPFVALWPNSSLGPGTLWPLVTQVSTQMSPLTRDCLCPFNLKFFPSPSVTLFYLHHSICCYLKWSFFCCCLCHWTASMMKAGALSWLSEVGVMQQWWMEGQLEGGGLNGWDVARSAHLLKPLQVSGLSHVQ